VAFAELGLNWREHVETDTRILQRSSYPLRGDSAKLRSATGWSPTVSFTELVTTLLHEAEKGYETI
jgi:GDPmannose 4,6-dehydratase